MTTAKVHLTMSAMGKPDTIVGALCREIGVSRQTLYRYVGPSGEIRADGKELLEKR